MWEALGGASGAVQGREEGQGGVYGQSGDL